MSTGRDKHAFLGGGRGARASHPDQSIPSSFCVDGFLGFSFWFRIIGIFFVIPGFFLHIDGLFWIGIILQVFGLIIWERGY